MRFARQHPFYGWLFLEPDDYRRIQNQLIQMRDADLKKGDNVSANKNFDRVMADKITQGLDAKKIDIASKIGKKPEETED